MNLKNLLPLLFGAISFVSLTAQAQKGNNYQYTVDLSTVKDDRVRVELIPPRLTSDEITFYLPKIIPGTYAIADYGRYVSDFSVVDKKGRPLSFERLNDNAWKIKTASKIHKITYWVNDSYDTEITGPKIFEPAGTNIEENKNFIINSAGYFGYLENLKEIPVTLNVIRTEAFYGSTGLIPQKSGEPLTKIKLEKGTDTKGKKVDTYLTDDYDQLIDSPLMYSLPDTAIIKVGNTEVLIGAYSAGKKVNAKEIAASVREVLMAQKEYLGG